MKKNILLVCGIIAGYVNNCLAVDPIMWGAADHFDGCYSFYCVAPEQWYPLSDPSHRNCADYTAMCVYLDGKETGVASCRTCKPGYELEQGLAGISACAPENYTDIGDNGGGVSRYDYTSCTKNCNTTTCASTSWTAKGTGYETRINRTCSATGASGTCNSITEYRCAAGYYGSSTNGTSGCTQCPQWTGVYTNPDKTTLARGTSSAGTTAITGCYVTPGTYYGAIGTFKTTSNCAYSS